MRTIPKVRWLMLGISFLVLGNPVLHAQSYDLSFNLALNHVCFSSDGGCGYMNDYGQWCTDDGTLLSGPEFTCPANGAYHIFYNPANSSVPAATMPGTPTHHTITIRTVNSYAASSANTGYTYNITLENVNIDRRSYESTDVFSYYQRIGAPFDAGDDCINVNLTLVGTNQLVGDRGRNAALCYTRYDGPEGGKWHGVTGNGKLTIGGTGTLRAYKTAKVNSGAVIGSKQVNGQNAQTESVCNGHIVFNSGTIIAEAMTPTNNNFDNCGSYAAAIGGGANCRCGDITINGGNITATAWATAAAIGSGGGLTGFGSDVSGSIKITGGTVTTYNTTLTIFHFADLGHHYTVYETGVGIGAGSSNYREGGAVREPIEISGGTVKVWKKLATEAEWTYGFIGGGNSNTGHTGDPYEVAHSGGSALVKVTGGKIYAANVGGGSANLAGANANGGYAELVIDMDNANDTLFLTGTIGGGNTVSGKGGNAKVVVRSGNGKVYASNIGGGNSQTGNGGDADVTVSGGSIVVSGKIGGGNSSGAGTGGNASIYVTGGTLDCGSIGGGNSSTGAPGAVAAEPSSTNPSGAGIYISGDSKITMTSGYIGGGTNDVGDIGKATAYINVTHPESTIQGQFILCNNTSTMTDHCFFMMKAGTIDNTNLGAIGDTSHPRLKAEGGAVYMEDNYGEVIIDGGIIKNATGTLGGAIYMSNGTFSMSNGILGGETFDDANVADSIGGALYMGGGSFEMTGGSIKYNKATHNGGGIYLANGSASFTNGNLNDNEATTGFGGGLYLGGGSITVNSADIKGNHAYSQGGGIHVESGNFTMTGGAIGGTIADGNYTTGEGSMGGGLYMGGGTANILGGTISGNYTDVEGHGGGIYMYGGTCILKGGARIGGTTPNYANSADLGGGIYSAGGTITVEGGLIEYNTASSDGGGVYSNGRTAVVNIQRQGTADSYLRYNIAVRGGGIFANRGIVNFSDGDISFNHATEAGGGIYVNLLNDTVFGTLNLKGNAVLNGNYVPLGKKGGGVYLLGRVIVGESSAKTGSSVRAETNYADAYGATITNANRNNIYLPEPQVRDHHTGLITVIQGGIDNHSRVGFSVEANRVPVIYCEEATGSYDYLDEFTTGPGHNFQNVLFDDSHRFISVHYTIFPRDRFDWDHVYLFGFWPEEVTSEPTGFALNNIDSEEDLAWLISVVNGRYTVADGTTDTTYTLLPNSLSGCTVELNADIDMSRLGWVPIGTTTKPGHANKPFKGTFHGNGYTITGISGMAYKDHYAYGLFGNVENATITDVFVKDAEFYIEDNQNLILGGLVGETYGNTTVGNTEVSSLLVAANTNTIVGGLIGRQNAGTVHSSIAIPDMIAGCMGGLVGVLASGNHYNSFTNAKFTELSGNSSYMGGLVAENSGTLENCYVRLRDSVPASANFGLLVGWNKTDGSMKYCYSPDAGTGQQYVAEKQGIFTDYRYYDNNTQVPYLYARRDNQVHPVEGDTTYIPVDYDDQHHNHEVTTPSDKQMLLCLNNWVTAKNAETGTHPTYSGWQRPTTKVINDDLPVLMMDKAEAIAATNDDPYLYYGAVNTLIGTYTSPSQAIWLYKSNDSLVDNSLSDAKLYIAEHNIDGKPLTAIPANGAEVNAYVSVTLDNSAGNQGANATFGDGTADYTDWHMFSTPLKNAPLGIDYHGDGAEYSADFTFPGHPADMPYYLFYEDGRGYFPTHRYGNYGYPANDNNLTDASNAGNYYREWDFYTYYEPEYHWINFKRNWNSHWHQNAPTVKIDYNNEDTLVLGRGYLLATREPNTFLQCYGTLTDGDVSIDVTRDGCYSTGYNFLGNPYLAYLDFDKFAMKNAALFGGADSAAYAIIDEDPIPGEPDSLANLRGGYKYYAPNASLNKHTASQFIAPHQGFMILARNAGSAEFYNTMRAMKDTIGDGMFRGAERLAYALVNLMAYDGNGNRDIATVELGRPDKGGAPLMRELKMATCHVYSRYEGKDWAIAFTQPGITEVAVRFEAYADGEYTLRWDTENGNFHYLHLLDNMTGADVDCLAETEYRFHANKEDYRSRFRLVFDYTGIEEPDNNGDQVTFAYQSGDELVITGEGTLTMFDVTGRAVMSTEIHGTQNALSLPNVSTGVYLLRLGTANGTKVQKIVINK